MSVEPPSTTSDRFRWARTPIVWVLTFLFVVSATWFAVLYWRGVEKDSLDMEFAKALLNVGVVSVAATVLSLLVVSYQRQAEREERSRELRAEAQRATSEAERARLTYRDELLKGTLARITGGYNNTKRARRKLRALGRIVRCDVIGVDLDRYDECMAEINDAQLELEAIKSDVKTSRVAYPSADILSPSLRRMEQYLGELLEEYETARYGGGVIERSLPLEKLPRLSDFLGPSRGSKFAKAFSDQHSVAREAIRGDLLHLNIAPEPLAAVSEDNRHMDGV